MNRLSKIYIAGHKGMVGSAIWKALEKKGYSNLLGRTSKELDLRDQAGVNLFISSEKPDVIIDAAAKVGGILANSENQYEFLLENMLIQNNLIHAAHTNNVSKFIFLASSCIYPKLATQPLKEEYLLTGPLEPTNEGYAVAKITGVKLCEFIRNQYNKDFVSLMPTNLFGPFDNFDLKSSHVLPAMLRKFHEAKHNNQPVKLWGSGTPMREFLYVDDLAKAVLFVLENKLSEHLYNVGSGKDITIKQLAEIIQKIVGHKGELIWDITKPDGTPRKLLDVSKLNKLAWDSQIDLQQGIEKTYEWFLNNIDEVKK
jgi:GDP-L-fucose synthase